MPKNKIDPATILNNDWVDYTISIRSDEVELSSLLCDKKFKEAQLKNMEMLVNLGKLELWLLKKLDNEN